MYCRSRVRVLEMNSYQQMISGVSFTLILGYQISATDCYLDVKNKVTKVCCKGDVFYESLKA